jgi:copper chaperone CopZ
MDTITDTAVYNVSGMTCGHCGSSVTTEVSQVLGVRNATVDLAAGTLTVVIDRAVEREQIAAAVAEAGYTLEP